MIALEPKKYTVGDYDVLLNSQHRGESITETAR